LKDVTKQFFAIVICVAIVYALHIASGQQIKIPFWIKNTAKWWYERQIADSEFTKGIQYLIQNKIMIVPTSNSTTTKEDKIPTWVKNNAGWWANGTISDTEFVAGIQYLINLGIIYVNPAQNSAVNNTQSQCSNLTTAAAKETCLQQIQYDNKIKNAITTSTSYIIGPVAFYYINSESQLADNGKSILTVHFAVEDNSDEQVTMSCQRQDFCNYALSDGEKEIPYTTNTLVYGSLTLTSKIPKFVDWTFYGKFDNTKNYSFLIKEPWGTGTIPIKFNGK
jgi:hypothetical protein